MQKIITVLLVLVGVIHLIPVTGILGAEHLTSLYGLSFQEPNIAILMQHRAILFGLLGLFLIYSAFNSALQLLAFIAGLVSVVSFIAIASTVDGYNDEIRKVVIADIVAVIFLILAVSLYYIARRKS